MIASPLTVAVGRASTVTTAFPDAVPLQSASEIAVTAYAVVAVGDTVRVAGLAPTALCVRPSDQVTFHGPVPVSRAPIVVTPPLQTAAVPNTVAVGIGLTVTAVAAEVALQPFASVTVTLY